MRRRLESWAVPDWHNHAPESCVPRTPRSPNPLPPTQAVCLELEADNPRDKHATLVLDAGSGAALGHVPREVARLLGPLLAAQLVAVEGCVLEAPASSRASVPVEFQVGAAGRWVACLYRGGCVGEVGRGVMRAGCQSHHDPVVGGNSPTPSPPLTGSHYPQAHPGSNPCNPQVQLLSDQEADVQAVAAAALRLQAATQPAASGDRLRANFDCVLEAVWQEDARLLDREEGDFRETFSVSV